MPPRKKTATAAEVPAPRATPTMYQPGERPSVGTVLGCRACGSPESRVLMTTRNESARMIWRRRRCVACGTVWMSKTPL